jgi:hypothetical protein
MRDIIALIESATLPFNLNDQFVAKVQAYLHEHLGDWADDFPDLKLAIMQAWQLIHDEGVPDNGVIEVYREELRPSEQIANHNYGTLGACWSWDANGAGTCHHENAYDEHGRENVEAIVFIGEVSLSDVEWVQTIAKNLVLKNEREINIRDGARVRLEGQYKAGARGYEPLADQVYQISNINDF